MNERNYLRISLLVLSLIILYFVFQIFHIFLLPVSLAIIMVTLCYPVFNWTANKLKGKRNLAALLTCIWVTTAIIIPLLTLLVLLTNQIGSMYRQIQMQVDNSSLQDVLNLESSLYVRALIDWINLYVDLEGLDIVDRFTSGFEQMSLAFLRQSAHIVQGAFSVIANFFIMLLTMFFLFKDGSRLVEEIKTIVPLPKYHKESIVNKFQEVSKATVVGTLLTALAQGIAGGVLFWTVGVPNAIFWGFLTGLFSLLPFVGTGIVWGPWAIYLLITTSTIQGIVLVIGGFLVAFIDNVLRPLFIEGKTKMHTLLVFMSIVGGISYFGIEGVIFGPIIVALGLTFLELYKVEFKQELAKSNEA